MKKFIISLLTIAITISIAGCGSTTNISNSEIDLPTSTSTPESTPTPTPMALAKEIIGTWEADNGVLWEYKDDGICTLNFSNFNTYDTSTAAEVVRKQLPLSFNYKVDGDYLVFTMGADHYRNHTIIKNDIKYETDSICGETTTMKRVTSSRESLSQQEKVLTVAVAEEYPPFEYYENGELVGFDIDLINHIADRLGYKIEFSQMQFDALLMAVNAGKVDCAISGIIATPEKENAVNFTSPYITTKMDSEGTETETYSIALNPNDNELLSEMNKIISEAQNDGTIQTLIEKYNIQT